MATNTLIAYFVVSGDDAKLERQYLKIVTEYSISVSGTTATATLTSTMYVHRDSYGPSSAKKAGDCYITIGGTKINVISSGAALPILDDSYVQIGNSVSHTITYDASTAKKVDIEAQFDTTDNNKKINNYIIPVSSYPHGTGTLAEGSTSLTFPAQRSACTAPTSFIASPAVFEDDITLTWSGAKGGTNNDITGYDCQWRVSYDNGVSWSDWASSSINTSGGQENWTGWPRGIAFHYRVRTKGSAGSSYYSGWVESNTVRRNSTPYVPTNPRLSASFVASGERVTVSWNPSGDYDGNYNGCRLSTRVNGGEIQTVSGGVETSRNVRVTGNLGDVIEFLVRAEDQLGAASDWLSLGIVTICGFANICTGSACERHFVCIHDGSKWDKYAPYAFDGESWQIVER